MLGRQERAEAAGPPQVSSGGEGDPASPPIPTPVQYVNSFSAKSYAVSLTVQSRRLLGPINVRTGN